VYALEVNRIPFYIGIGRSERASDRVRYVRYMMRRDTAGKPVNWCLSSRVIAEFCRRGHQVRVRYLRRWLTRRQALTFEYDKITRLVSRGTVLANRQHNRCYPSSHLQVIRAVLKRGQSQR